MMKHFVALFSFLVCTLFALAQDTAGAKETATGLKADGKIYVVVAVVVTILIGLTLYLVSLDRKISRIEKQHP